MRRPPSAVTSTPIPATEAPKPATAEVLSSDQIEAAPVDDDAAPLTSSAAADVVLPVASCVAEPEVVDAGADPVPASDEAAGLETDADDDVESLGSEEPLVRGALLEDGGSLDTGALLEAGVLLLEAGALDEAGALGVLTSTVVDSVDGCEAADAEVGSV